MKSICVVTGSRAEYGIMKPLLEKLHKARQTHEENVAFR